MRVEDVLEQELLLSAEAFRELRRMRDLLSESAQQDVLAVPVLPHLHSDLLVYLDELGVVQILQLEVKFADFWLQLTDFDLLGHAFDLVLVVRQAGLSQLAA